MTDTCAYCGRKLLPAVSNKISRNLNIEIYQGCNCKASLDAIRQQEEQARAEKQKQKEENLQKALLRAGVKKRYLSAQHPNAIQLAQKVLSGKSLYIDGGFGTGKTHLASAIACQLIKAHKQVQMLTGVDFTLRLQSTFGTSESEEEVLMRYATGGVLILDDLGKEPPSDWVVSRLFAIINERYDQLLPIVITSNYTRGQLVTRLGRNGDTDTAEALVSRLVEMCDVVHMDGKDRRLSH